MTRLLGWVGPGPASVEISEAVVRAASADGAEADLPPPGGAPRRRLADADGPPLFFARAAGGVLFASRARALLATGLVHRTLDPVGVAGFLWRGAPVAARSWIAGVEAVPRGSQLDLEAGAVLGPVRAAEAPSSASSLDDLLGAEARPGEEAFLPTAGRLPSLVLLCVLAAHGRAATALVARWPGTPPDGLHDAARAARAAGGAVEVVDFSAYDAQGALSEFLNATDVPSVDAFGLHLLDGAAQRLGAKVVLRSTGGAALFLEGAAFAGLRGGAWRGRSPRRASVTDPFDVGAQTADEDRAYRRTPVPRLYARLALLPAATRAALMPGVSRATDGAWVVEGRTPLDRLSRAARAAAASGSLGEASSEPVVRRPYLHPDVADAAGRRSDEARFGRPGSGGWLARRLRAAHAWAAPRPSAGFDGALDLWLRGPLSGWLAERLSPDRLRAQGVVSPTAVAALSERFRTRTAGVGARAIFALALLSHAIERDGLAGRSP